MQATWSQPVVEVVVFSNDTAHYEVVVATDGTSSSRSVPTVRQDQLEPPSDALLGQVLQMGHTQ